ncbi:hypothetical protein J6590_005560 [Homalodisca vitripennis]|nr:hypothetical protein J6590_005560 [Homalodisca vitripennis]
MNEAAVTRMTSLNQLFCCMLQLAARSWIEATFQKRECVKFIPSPKDEHSWIKICKAPSRRLPNGFVYDSRTSSFYLEDLNASPPHRRAVTS